MHIRWTYIYNADESFFIYKKNDKEQIIIKAKCLYIRGCYVNFKDSFWHKLGDFFNFVDLYDMKVLCGPKKQLNNESKLFQLNNSLIKSVKKSQNVSIGKSYVVKGLTAYEKVQNKKTPLIVKSLSGIRSIVVDQNSYKAWDIAKINNMPVLFQEKINGHDLRVHILQNKLFAKQSFSKANVDYRYDKGFFNLLDVDLDENLSSLCLNISKEEDNELLGIDFIKTNSGYVVLEANPSPGWSAYHPYDGIKMNPFISNLLTVFNNA